MDAKFKFGELVELSNTKGYVSKIELWEGKVFYKIDLDDKRLAYAYVPEEMLWGLGTEGEING